MSALEIRKPCRGAGARLSARAAPDPPSVGDLRFRTLVGEAAWAELPEAVRRRFSKCLAPEETLIYRGSVVDTQLSRAGRVLSFLARAIGAPLPLTNGATGPALVVVTEDPRLGGQSWLRIYTRPGRFPQAINSAKRFRGPTGLEEYVGCGIGMSLRVTVEERRAHLPLGGLFPGARPLASADPARTAPRPHADRAPR